MKTLRNLVSVLVVALICAAVNGTIIQPDPNHVIVVTEQFFDLNGNRACDVGEYVLINISTDTSLHQFEVGMQVEGPAELVEVNGGPNANHVGGTTKWEYSGISNNIIAIMANESQTGVGFGPGPLVSGLRINFLAPGEMFVYIANVGKTCMENQECTPIPNDHFYGISCVIVPEPATIGLFGLGLFAVKAARGRKN